MGNWSCMVKLTVQILKIFAADSANGIFEKVTDLAILNITYSKPGHNITEKNEPSTFKIISVIILVQLKPGLPL